MVLGKESTVNVCGN